MAKRILRTLTQAGMVVALTFLLIFIADSRYRVLPTSIHSALPTHHVGTVITDATITFCSSLNPLSSCRLDPDKWHRIEKDLYLNSGWVQSAWLHVKRKKEEELTSDDKVVVGVKIGRLDPGVGEKDQHVARWESRPGGLWLLRSNGRHDSDSDRAITSVDVLFGADAVDPRPGWTLARTPFLIDTDKSLQPARLSTRQGHPQKQQANRDIVPRVGKDGRFKILQVSDAHLATGVGVCRDAIGADGNPSQNCEADTRTLDFIEKILDDEKPNLVVLSGDQVEGPQAPDTQSAIFKFAAPLIEREIPYAAIFGNHDEEGAHLSRSAQMSLLQTLPFSLSQPGPENVAGVGNYVVEVLAPTSHHSALTLYMLDTHSLTPDEKHYKGYDWLKPSQIEWFKSTSNTLKQSKEHARYTHIHMDMAFIHIPLPEYAEKGLVVKGGQWKEGVTAPGFNSHFYDALVEEGVVAVGCGHDHVNDYCALRPAGGEYGWWGRAPQSASGTVDVLCRRQRVWRVCWVRGFPSQGQSLGGGYEYGADCDVEAGRVLRRRGGEENRRVDDCGWREGGESLNEIPSRGRRASW